MKDDADFGFSVAYSFVAHLVVGALVIYLVFLKKEKEKLPLVMERFCATYGYGLDDLLALPVAPRNVTT